MANITQCLYYLKYLTSSILTKIVSNIQIPCYAVKKKDPKLSSQEITLRFLVMKNSSKYVHVPVKVSIKKPMQVMINITILTIFNSSTSTHVNIFIC